MVGTTAAEVLVVVDVQAQDKNTLSHTLSLSHTLTLSLSRTHTLSTTLSLAGRVEGLVGTTAAEVLVVVDVQPRDRVVLPPTPSTLRDTINFTRHSQLYATLSTFPPENTGVPRV